MDFYTYLHCKPNGIPFYVGKGHGNRSHVFDSGRNKYHKNIVSKYGKENIQIFVFPCESEDQAFADEVQQIAQFRNDGIKLCNLTDGGEGVSGLIISDETREKMRIASSNPSKETRLKMSIARKNRIITEETRKKMSDTMKNKGIKLTQSQKEKLIQCNIGRKFTEETKQKMRDAKIGKKHTEETKLKMSLSRKGQKRSEEIREKMRNAWVLRKQKMEQLNCA